MSIAFFPGSFDPIHNGHVELIAQATQLFGRVVVATMHNPSKPSGTFTPEERLAMIRASIAHLPGARAEAFTGLVVHAARSVGADLVVKGVRTGADFEFEMQMAQTNRSVSGILTAMLPTAPQWSFLSSRFVREIAHYGGDVRHLVPAVVAERLAALAPKADDKGRS